MVHQNGRHDEQSPLSRLWRHRPTYRRHLSVRGEASAVQSSVSVRRDVSRHQPTRHEVRGGTLGARSKGAILYVLECCPFLWGGYKCPVAEPRAKGNPRFRG